MSEMAVMLNSEIPLAQALNLISVKESRKRFKGDLWKTLSYDPARHGFFSGDGDAGWRISRLS